ncbi:MAG: FCD domain-containing protein [Granulosicoccaceae bacterium]
MTEIISMRLGSTEIAGLIRAEIKQGDIGQHDRLPPERLLAAKYGVARGTIREALNRLAEENLVSIRPGSGTYITYDPEAAAHTVIMSARPLELIDARFALEPHLCRLAVLHARTQDLDEMEILMEQMETCGDDVIRFSVADTQLHTSLAESTGNTLLIWVVSQINSVRNQPEWSNMRQITLNAATMAVYNRQHRQILTAIRAREPEAAAAMMKEHLETARLSLTRSAST